MKPDLIDKNRMVKRFIDLAKIPSPSRKEGKLAKYLMSELKKLGAKVRTDNAHKKFTGEVGNIIAHFLGNIKSRPLMLNTHIDTVPVENKIEPEIKKGRIIGNGKTILGADAKAGVAVIWEVLTILKENKDKLKFPPIEAVFTVAEEPGLLGAKHLDYSRVKSKYGVALDSSHADALTVKSPARMQLEIKIFGKPVHAGIEPEKGISALKVAANAVSAINFGRIDFETTSNLAVIEGGSATNVVTPEVTIKGEVRSINIAKMKRQVAYIKKGFEREVKKSRKKIDGSLYSAKLKFKAGQDIPHIDISKNDKIVKLVLSAGRKNKIKIKPIAFAPSDASIFFSRGIHMPNLGCGERNPHSKNEYLDLQDFFNCARIILDAVVDFRD